MDYWKNYWETPMMTFWRRLNAELTKAGAKPVLFGDAFLAYGSNRDPEVAARMIAGRQDSEREATLSPQTAA